MSRPRERRANAAERVREPIKELGLDYEMEMVTDRAEHPKYGLMMTRGRAVDGGQAVQGRLRGEKEIRALLEA